jgi:hypothetical protein
MCYKRTQCFVGSWINNQIGQEDQREGIVQRDELKMEGLERERWKREGLKCYREEQHPFLRVNGIDQ